MLFYSTNCTCAILVEKLYVLVEKSLPAIVHAVTSLSKPEIMKKLFFLFIIAICSTLTTSAQLNSAYTQALNNVFDSICNRYNIKGATAAIYVPNEGKWERCYGVSYGSVSINSNMYMGIGSNTKTFTAVLMLKLQEQGKLNLDDTIGQWIHHPNIPGKITIRQLLNHTSGLYSYTMNSDINDYITPDYTRIWPPDSTLNLVKPPVAAPGGAWDYCNTNYLLAGLIVRAVTGKPYEQVLRSEILVPNGLNETYLFPHEMPNGTIPHSWSNVLSQGNYMEDLVAVHNYSHNAFLSLAYSAGGIMSTARDNALFWHKLVSGQILNSSSMAEFQQGVYISQWQHYGLGVFIFDHYNGRTVLSHGGTNFGFINENLADKVTGVSISVLTNQDSIDNIVLQNRLVSALHKVTLQYTGISNTTASSQEISIYPNPVTNSLHINTGNTPQSMVSIYDPAGRMIQTQQLTNGDNVTDVSTLPAGTYFLSIQNDKGILHRQTIQKL